MLKSNNVDEKNTKKELTSTSRVIIFHFIGTLFIKSSQKPHIWIKN